MKIEYLKDGNVVALASARRDRKFPAIAQIEAYWHGLRNGRLMPTRHDVDPRGIGDNLAHAFILERIAPGHARIRLAGQHVSDILSMEVRGMPISAFFTPQARQEVQDALESVFDMPAEVNLTLQSESGIFQKSLDAQMILLPLKDREGRVTRVLGAFQVDGKLTRAPLRFNIRTLDARPLTVDQTAAQKTRDAEHRQQQEMKRPGYWDMRGAPTSEATDRTIPDVTRVDIRPTGDRQNRKTDGHIMRPSGDAGDRGIPVPGMAELAASFHGTPDSMRAGPLARPGGHLRIVPQD
ncbi:PAS domain-containing protein [Aliiroseovarius sp. S1339]|uniref:PAS domain-containing protein n=1 Tax=Aliiroseovarius sp. S1339 TaxID=2936990 RepID=UPI0020C093F5|nr:PAS domain-containing protein [Aliiroseovarius sp. S1339]MCK8463576.1 PAS domain-containing protein [Aliiroseovarius sp. S1339]